MHLVVDLMQKRKKPPDDLVAVKKVRNLNCGSSVPNFATINKSHFICDEILVILNQFSPGSLRGVCRRFEILNRENRTFLSFKCQDPENDFQPMPDFIKKQIILSPKLDRLEIHKISTFDFSILQRIAVEGKVSTHLTHLVLRDIPQTKINDAVIRSLIIRLPKLLHLDVVGCLGISASSIAVLKGRSPALQNLLVGHSGPPSRGVQPMHNWKGFSNFLDYENLQSLCVSFRVISLIDDVLKFRHLKHLELRYVEFSDPATHLDDRKFFSQFDCLETLALEGVPEIIVSEESMISLAKSSSHTLVKLDLSFPKGENLGIEQIMEFKKLKFLKLQDHTHRITSEVCRVLMERLPLLEVLDVTGCWRVDNSLFSQNFQILSGENFHELCIGRTSFGENRLANVGNYFSRFGAPNGKLVWDPKGTSLWTFPSR
eukprot:GHVP01054921.1.p1 GENE.GHVP01054921.1~~GHVP01054921.1.p1  ORF type:complete len:430 (+),score=75.19 GHVP01054921.1:900-2189(+)